VSWAPHWNIAPHSAGPHCPPRQEAAQAHVQFGAVGWLIPYWAKDRSIAVKTINAMSETAAEKPAFRDAMSRRRCLIPADAFYEWKKIGTKEKQPYSFGMMDDSVFAFAGLWERWRDPAGEVLETCSILTTKPNALVADVHDRMPAILEAGRLRFVVGSWGDKRNACSRVPQTIPFRIDEQISCKHASKPA
jgi:putative SOS response-associated peptidase YedK